MVQEAIGHPLDREKLDDAREAAEIKLGYLIGRFGDAEGHRREPWYLAYLIIEQLCSDSLSKITQDLWQFDHEDRDKK